MKRFNSFKYSISEGFRGLGQNILMSVGAILMLICALVIVGSIALITWNINSIVDEVGDQNEIVVFVDETLTESEIKELGEKIEAIPHVYHTIFTSRSEALDDMRSELGEYSDILDGLEDDNPLRDSFRVGLDDIANADSVIAALESTEGIAKVRARTDVIAGFLNLRNMVGTVGLTLIIVLGVISVFIISHSIRVSAYTRREEIAIMRMVGATKTFIHGAFLVEGLLIGIIGAAAAFGIQWLVYDYALLPAMETLPMLSFRSFGDAVWYIAAGFAAIGLAFGLFGSGITIRKYLRK